MICATCQHERRKRFGKDRKGRQRFRCLDCQAVFVEPEARPLGDMRISKEKAVLAIRMLLEGTSIRAIVRLTGLSKNTVASLLLLVGERCRLFWMARMRNLPAKDVQCDELWGFIGCKERTRKLLDKSEDFGDSYCFLAIERDTKLVLTYHVGKRDFWDTHEFTYKLRAATAGKFQVTTDGYTPYCVAIPEALHDRGIDYSQLIKIFATQSGRDQSRYSPAPIKSIKRKAMWGHPDMDRCSTSHAERLNLSIRMGVRRMTRLTNAFSKSWRHHEAALALWLTFYNFCRVHQTLKTTPAVAAKIADETWTVERMLDELAKVDE